MYVLYIPIFIFGFLMLFYGIFVLIRPVKWEDREDEPGKALNRVKGRPGYFGKHAKASRELWDKAQKSYGKYSIIMGILQILLAVPEVRLFAYVCNHYIEEDTTIPGVLIIVLPAFILIGLIHLCTEIKLKSVE